MARTVAPPPPNARDFFVKTLATGMGSPTPLGMGYIYECVDNLMQAAERDPEIELVMMLVKGPYTSMVGVANGQPITDSDKFRQILMRTMLNL